MLQARSVDCLEPGHGGGVGTFKPAAKTADVRSDTTRPHLISQPLLHLSSNGDLNLDTGLDVDDDLLDDLGRGVQAIVDLWLVLST